MFRFMLRCNIDLPPASNQGLGMREGFDAWDAIGDTSGPTGPSIDYGPGYDDLDEPETDGTKTETEQVGQNSQAAQTSETDKSKADAEKPVFKPYEFKGKVNGQEKTQKFNSQAELDATIANGLLAPQLHTALLAAKRDIAEMKSDAQWAKDLQAFAQESPVEFLDHMFEHMLDEKEAASYILKKHDEYSHMSRMSPEQYEMYKTNKEAKKILREQQYQQQLAEEARHEQAKAVQLKEAAQFETWKEGELRKWTSKIPEKFRESVIENLKLVAAFAKHQIDLGHDYGYDKMSRHLEKLMSPLVTLHSSPSQSKKEELARNQAKTASETEKLRNMTKQNSAPPPQKPKSVSEAFAKLRREALASMNN